MSSLIDIPNNISARPSLTTSPIVSESNSKTSDTVVCRYGYYWNISAQTWEFCLPSKNDHLQIILKNTKNDAVMGALKKFQRGEICKRDTSTYLRNGIREWLVEKCQSVHGPVQEEKFVQYVWYRMCQQKRDKANTMEFVIYTGLDSAKDKLEAHYAEFPDERKTETELIMLFKKFSSWPLVVSSEQRRIASKKRHEKEERLIHNKFCGNRSAYNSWKTLNEKVAHGRIRNVTPQLLRQFANWLGEHPDYLYPGSRCIAVETAEQSLCETFTTTAKEDCCHREVSKEHMLAAISSLMGGLAAGNLTVVVKFDRSPQQFTMTDKYPLLVMHGVQRLISDSEHRIIAVHSDKLVFKETNYVTKRLPDNFHTQLSGHCEREGLFKKVKCHKVFAYTPGLVTSVLCRGQTSDGDHFHIRLRLTSAANKTFDFQDFCQSKHRNFINSLRSEAASSPSISNSSKEIQTANRMAAIRRPMPPSPSFSTHKNMARELIELGKMFKDGLLSKQEFTNAKRELIN